ncbi:MAG: Asp-tRNA(Asn)/Glu-tRNA(Gln) amidotransferase subunit GatA [Candidatus Porifericomitaceae bacterium WSBS_2022_MAG_OTU9]
METETFCDLRRYSEALHKRELGSEELARHALQRAQALNPKLNALITICDETRVLAQAKAADKRLAAGEAGPLCGIPIIHKDVFCTKGVRTTCASRMLDNFVAPYNATIVERLNQAGMVTIGKANMDEFAMGSSTENSYYGPVRNPWQQDHVPGGSSGGSAVAVAAGIVPCATGSDTGGSIRQPAALCGITGLKPTYGRVSRHGMVAFASSLEQAGSMTRTAADAALLLQAMAGTDMLDATTVQNPAVDDYTANLEQPLDGLKLGFPEQQVQQSLGSDALKLCNQTLASMRELGAEIVPVQLPRQSLCMAAYYIIAGAECSANLARYDGVRYGYRSSDYEEDLEELYIRSRSEGFGPEVKRRLLTGTYVLSAGYQDAFYHQALRVRHYIHDQIMQALDGADAIITPTTAAPAFPLGEKTSDPIAMYMSDVFTTGANLSGLPAISVPAGFINQLPFGMQFMAAPFAESLLLRIAHQYQQHSNWHRQTPKLELDTA